MKLLFMMLMVITWLPAQPCLGQKVAKFPVSVASKTIGFSPLWFASRKGFFEREGFDAQLVLMRGAEKAAMALVGESVFVAAGSADTFISAVESNINLSIISGFINRPSFFIMAQNKYRSYEDLRHKVFGVTNISSGPAVALRYVLKSKGLEYPRDYKLTPAGPVAERTMGLSSGRIDATPLGIPFNFMAEELGFHTIGSYLDVIPNYQVSVLAVNRSWAAKNRPLVVKFLKGMILSMRSLFDNKEQGVEFLANELKIDKKYAIRGWEFYKEKGLWPKDMDINLEGMKTTIQIYNETNPPSPASTPHKYLDLSYLKDAWKDIGSQ